MNLYFDNAAAVPVLPETLNEFQKLFLRYYGNQEAMGAAGANAAKAVRNASGEMLRALCGKSADSYNCLWTNTGTDSIRAVFAVLRKRFPSGGVVLCNDGEHASILQELKRLPPIFEIRKVNIRPDGRIDPDDFLVKLSSNCVFAVIHHVQPETGAIQNLPVFRKMLSNVSPQALFFADTIQSVCKIPIPWQEAGLDFATLSGQKLGAPSGSALIFRKELKRPVESLRGEAHILGRLPPPFCLLLASRICFLCEHMEENSKCALQLKQHLLLKLEQQIPDKFRLTLPPGTPASPYILHLLMSGRKEVYQGAILSRTLSSAGISIAPGSACSSESPLPSLFLTAMGIRKIEAFSALRISTFLQNRKEDVEQLVHELKKSLDEY